MATSVFAPHYVTKPAGYTSVFLAGSIDQGRAAEWQHELTTMLSTQRIQFLNPRRPDWNTAWTEDDPQFIEQVTWELDHLDAADIIVMYFAPGSQTPISLLELGLYAKHPNLIVCCPSGYWRKGNVDIVCRRHKIATVPDLAAISAKIQSILPIL